MEGGWLPTLMTSDPEAGFELAIKLGRMGVKAAQPFDSVRQALRSNYEQDSEQLIAVSHVVAVHFQTIAAANNYWN